jgi:pimeloyl-ACP methyl ester carboxylesterase
MMFAAKSAVRPCRMAFSTIHFNRTAPTHKHTQDV